MRRVNRLVMVDTHARPGLWRSSLDEQKAVGQSIEYAQLSCSAAGDPYWVELRPLEASRSVICRLVSGKLETVTPSQFSVRSKVHEYGGQSWCHLDNAIAFVNEFDQQLYLQSLETGAQPKPLTSNITSRYIEPIWDCRLNRLLVIEEQHLVDGVQNRLISICLSNGVTEEIHSGYDFYSYPTINPIGGEIAFIAWNHPFQPWVSTELILITELATSVIAGDDFQQSLSQPLFTPKGELLVVSDRSNWWNIYRYDPLACELCPIKEAASDMIAAPWQSGLRHYDYGSGLAYTLIKHRGSEIFNQGSAVDDDNLANVRSLSIVGESLYCLVSFADRLDAVVKIDGKGLLEVITGGSKPLLESGCSVAKPMVFNAEGRKSYGYLYPAANADYPEVDQSTSPLVVFLHGGPTAATYPILNLKIQYWTQRGFSVLDLNYGGSSNYGREYRLALKHAWGDLEVNDIRIAVNCLVEQGVCDPNAIFIRGNSSGGYSALNALSQLDCFTGGASLYGVTDPLVLNRCTHKFESHYLEWLIGDPEVDLDRYMRLSPIHNIAGISAPVIFFQGEKDRVVLPSQTRAMVKALKGRDVNVEAHYFDDEAHGFRKLENVIQVLRAELAFYQGLLPGELG